MVSFRGASASQTSSPRRRILRVLVLTPLGPGGKGGIDRMMDYVREELSRAPIAEIDVDFLSTRGSGSIFWSPLYLASALARLAVRAIAGKVDVVHINLSSDGSTYRKILAAWTSRLVRVPYVVHLHSGRFPQFWDKAPPLLSGLITSLYRNAAAIIVLGKVWADFIHHRLPDYCQPVWILPNATPTVAGSPAPRTDAAMHVVYLGLFAPQKGIDELASAFEIMAKNNVSFRATAAGTGAVDAFRARMDASGLLDRVAVVNWLGASDVTRLLSMVDVLVLPSHSEALPVSIIEGFANGLAVVATPVGAIPELIEHERTGLLVPVRDAGALAEALSRLAREPDLRRALGDAARRHHAQTLAISPYLTGLVGIWRAAASR